MRSGVKYIHESSVHNLLSPTLIIQEILEHFSPQSVIDVGCWLWTFVKVLQDKWIDAYGVDGARVEQDKLFIDQEYFIERDLEKYQTFEQRYDLALSLEVAEHLSDKSAKDFVKTLTSSSDYIVFSAALPNQWWQNHLNEQKPEYREKIFNDEGYIFYDVFRHVFWNNPDIFWRYKQNMFLVAKQWVSVPNTLIERPPRHIIHPALYTLRHNQMSTIAQWKKSFFFYMSLFYTKIKNTLWLTKGH